MQRMQRIKQIDLEHCKEMWSSFLPKNFKASNCKGHSMIHPSIATIDDINEWFMNHNELSVWDKDLLCAWGGYKIALVDYDYSPTKEQKEEFEQLLIRFWMISKCGIRALYSGNGDGAIYYDKKYWKEALLLHYYHEGLLTLPNIPKRVDIFQGILLGYTMDSIYEYGNRIFERIKDFLLANHKDNKENEYELWEKSSDRLKNHIYRSIYQEEYEDPRYSTYSEFKKNYKVIQDFISDSIQKIENSDQVEKLKAFAYEGYKDDHLFRFLRKKSLNKNKKSAKKSKSKKSKSKKK